MTPDLLRCRRPGCGHPRHQHLISTPPGRCQTKRVSGPPPTPGTVTPEKPHGDRTVSPCECSGYLA